MLKHPDPEIQFLVEMLEGQRDQAVAQAAALFREVQQLQKQVSDLNQQRPVDQDITES
jgi:cell division protein FtsB